jgi:CRP-like cAMP-binding protein
MSGIEGPLMSAPKNGETAWANDGLSRASFQDEEGPEA